MKAFIKEFKEFISKGSVMDMAVGIIIGGAFTAIVTSLVNDVVMPLLSLLTGGFDFSKLSIPLGEGEEAAALNYGAFISAIINFLLIALVIFLITSAIFSLCDFKYTSLLILAGTALGQLFGFLFGEALGILLDNNDPCSTNDGWLIYLIVVFISFLSGFVIDLITYNRKKNKTSTI